MRNRKIRRRRARPLILLGAGGLGREILWLAEEAGRRVLGILDDAEHCHGKTLCGVPVLGRIDDWQAHTKAEFVIAIGAPRTRRAVARRMSKGPVPAVFGVLIHPSVRRSRFVEIAEGSIIAAGCILTTQVRIGHHTIVDRMVNVGHDCVLGDFCTISPLAPIGGNVTLGDGVWIGAGATIRQGLTVHAGAMVGMGSVVVKDVGANELVVGNPAHVLKRLEPFN